MVAYRRSTRHWLFGLTLATLAACGGATEEAPPLDACAVEPEGTMPAELAAALQTALTTGFDFAHAAGAVAEVVLPGVGVWYGAAGVADVRTSAPILTSARFRIGSITKTFAAAAVLQLVEEGAWQLADPVDDYVPGFDLGPEVTVERLLGHTAGIYNYTDDPGFLAGAQTYVEPAEVIDFALAHGALFPPGAGYTYSNTDYYLLGLALEHVEGKPFEQILRDRLLEPLELPSLYMEQYEDGFCAPTQGHVGFGTALTKGFSMSWAWAAGGLVGDVADLCTWADDLLLGDVLGPSMLERMKTENAFSTEPDRYALGLAWRTRGGRDVVGHTGSTMGFRGELFIDPASGVCVAVQTNDFFGVQDAVATPLWDAITAAGF